MIFFSDDSLDKSAETSMEYEAGDIPEDQSIAEAYVIARDLLISVIESIPVSSNNGWLFPDKGKSLPAQKLMSKYWNVAQWAKWRIFDA